MQASKSTSRPPNLLGKALPDPADYCRILASMEHGFVHTAAAAARGHGRGGALALAAVLLLALLGWLSYSDAGTPASADAPRVDAALAQTLPAAVPEALPPAAAIIHDIVEPIPAPSAPAAKAKAAAPAHTKKSAQPAAAQESDRDVTLLAALLAHVKGQDD